MKEAISFHNYPTSGCVVRKALYYKIGDFIKKFTLAMKQFILLSMMKINVNACEVLYHSIALTGTNL